MILIFVVLVTYSFLMNTQNTKDLQIPYSIVIDKLFVYFRILCSNMDEDIQKTLYATLLAGESRIGSVSCISF